MSILSPAEQSLLGVISHGGIGIVDRSGLEPAWLSTSVGKELVAACLTAHHQNMTVNVLTLMALARGVPKEAWAEVNTIFANGYGAVDPQSAIKACKRDYMVREASAMSSKLSGLLSTGKDNIDQWFPSFAHEVAGILDCQRDVSNNPLDIYNQGTPTTKFLSLSPILQEIMQVGYMGGMFMIYVSPSNQGKSTVLYSHACDCITQRRRTNLVTNERTPRYTLDRILRGLSGLTEEEIATRKGNTTERDEILHGWLKYCSEYLRIDDAGRYTQPWIKRLVSWDNPDVLIIDYLYAEPSNPKPAADMAVFLNDIANEKDICVITAGQLSDDNAKQFIRNDNHKTMALYGTSVPFQKSTHYYGIKRYREYPPAAYIHCWKSTFTNKVDFSRLLPFSEDRFIFDLRAQANHHQI